MNSCTIHVVNRQKIVIDLRYHEPIIWLVIEEITREVVLDYASLNLGKKKERISLLKLRRNGSPKPGQMKDAFGKELFVFARCGNTAEWTNGFPSETVEDAISEAIASWYSSTRVRASEDLARAICAQLTKKFV